MTALALIGYGEAAQAFALAAGWGANARAFDIKTDDPATRALKLADYARDGVTACSSFREALIGASTVLSLVTADQALIAAEHATPHLAPGALYLDMNSVAPQTKRAAAAIVEAGGAHYVDVAVMAPVSPARLAVSVLLSGPHAETAAVAMRTLGFSHVSVLGDAVGHASSVKMIRSIIVKGIEALTAEMMLAAEAAGVTDDVLASLGDGWDVKAAYNLERMETHGARRAAEMREVVRLLEALGIEPVMTRGTVQLQAATARSLPAEPETRQRHAA